MALRMRQRRSRHRRSTVEAPTADDTGVTKAEAQAKEKGKPESARAPEDKPGKADEPAVKSKSKPKAKTKAAPAADTGEGKKPELLSEAREGGPDDLKHIKGVGPKLEQALHDMGVFHFDQIAAWSEEEVAWADQNLVGFKGRVSRDDWVSQAKILADGGSTEFSDRAKKGDVY